jgi:hypothetical protein
MSCHRTIARAVIGIFVILLLAVPLPVTEAYAAGKGGGGGGGWGGGGRVGGGGGGRSMGVAHFSGSGVRSFGATHVTTRSFSPSVARSGPFKISPAVGGGTHVVGGASRTFATAGALSRPAGLAHHAGFARPAGFARVNAAFGNRFIANNAFKSAFVRAPVFHGRFQGSHWPWWRGGIVIGWIGPVFWPYASYDFFDYVYWPYGYDGFWPYAYEDVYYGIYGGYGYVDPAVRAGRSAPVPRGQGAAGGSQQRASSICGESAPQLTDWPIERISEAVEPNDAQRAALDELKAATAQSIDILKSACPNDLPSIPTGRLAALKIRLQVMLQAVQTVRPPLDRFYQLLSDEQKARFNAVSPTETAAVGKDQRDLTRLCTERGPGVADLPIDRIALAVRPTEAQQASLDELRAASAAASETLKTSCPTYQALTPTGRVEAMEKRLEAMLEAVKTVQPALTKFYDGLTDEQKARFNTLGSLRQGA